MAIRFQIQKLIKLTFYSNFMGDNDMGKYKISKVWK